MTNGNLFLNQQQQQQHDPPSSSLATRNFEMLQPSSLTTTMVVSDILLGSRDDHHHAIINPMGTLPCALISSEQQNTTLSTSNSLDIIIDTSIPSSQGVTPGHGVYTAPTPLQHTTTGNNKRRISMASTKSTGSNLSSSTPSSHPKTPPASSSSNISLHQHLDVDHTAVYVTPKTRQSLSYPNRDEIRPFPISNPQNHHHDSHITIIIQPTASSTLEHNNNNNGPMAVGFLFTLYSELSYWAKTIAVGQRDNALSNNEQFIRSIPYLSEYPHHDSIPKQLPNSLTNFHHLFDDVLHVILSFLDCKSILRFSLTASYYYHICHSNPVWDQYLYLECYIKFSKVSLPERFANLYNAKPERRRELLQNLDAPENSDLNFRQQQLLKAIDTFATFYQPSQEETLYNKYFELKNEYEEKLPQPTPIPQVNNIEVASVAHNELTGVDDVSIMNEQEESSDEIQSAIAYDEDINIFFETMNRVFNRGEPANLQSVTSINTSGSRLFPRKNSVATVDENPIASSKDLSSIVGRRSKELGILSGEDDFKTITNEGNDNQKPSMELKITSIPNKHFSMTSEQLEIDGTYNNEKATTNAEGHTMGWFGQLKASIAQQYRDFKEKAPSYQRRGHTPHVRYSRVPIDKLYSSYCIFRQEKIRNPIIRGKLLKLYVNQIKKRYRPITRWLNHVKLISWLFFMAFIVLLALKLDAYIDWPWFICFAPAVGSSVIAIILTVILWTPTIGWPIVLYRWVSGDCVGFWSSYAYCLSPRGRIIQLAAGILLPLTPCSTFFISLFPEVPLYLPCVVIAGTCLIWMYTCTQIIYKTGKRVYPYVLFLAWLGLGMFCGAIILKFAIPFFTANVKWYIVCTPLYIVIILIFIYQIKLSFDLSVASTKACVSLIWSLTFVAFMCIVILSLVFVILRMDEVISWSYTISFIPMYVILQMGLLYYGIRAFTNKLSPTVLKNPFSIFTNGMKNNADMDTYIL
ncbi:hypothetical protein C9374_006637 [Naegleria lovaniensis]|uniref:F-box domain-containing protein n=1 Tax=Naegleria lovaniensis TaxID=51637 RepID=A0AA88GMG8_NAELO|nr:uncharacterized protein C9374_006637 [Naegleria lovaniensis]KAG2379520.1 hypothetical protein C9374_006637 [Naegleria lovaniensis]